MHVKENKGGADDGGGGGKGDCVKCVLGLSGDGGGIYLQGAAMGRNIQHRSRRKGGGDI